MRDLLTLNPGSRRVACVLTLYIAASAGCGRQHTETHVQDEEIPPVESKEEEPLQVSEEESMSRAVPASDRPSKVPPFVVSDHGEWQLVWHDEFEGEDLDPAHWNKTVEGWGFGNNEKQFYTDEKENVWLEDGKLHLRAIVKEREGHPYTSARITTAGKVNWTYGRFEFRVKLPYGQGIWPAIWMMPENLNEHGGWPAAGEIDIMEMVGHTPGTVHGTLHYGKPWKNSGGGFSLPGGARFHDDFHTFEFEWLPGIFRWFVDGKQYLEQTDWYTSVPDARWPAPFNKPFYLLMNVAVGGNWPGYPDHTTVFPQEMVIDYVRVYEPVDPLPEVEDRPAAPAHLRPRDPMPDGNLIYNGSFDEGEKYWSLSEVEGGQGHFSVEDGKLHVSIDQAGNTVYSIQVIQQPLNIEKGQSYKVSFAARAAAPRPLRVTVGKASQHWDEYSGKREGAVGPEWKDHVFGFKMRHPSDPVARLVFDLGQSDVPVQFDNIRVEPVTNDIPRTLNGPTVIPAAEFDHKQGSVKEQPCEEGGLNLGWIGKGDWTEYALASARGGVYRVELRYAGEGHGQAGIHVDGQVLAAINLPSTGGWQQWQDAEGQIRLPAGNSVLRVECVAPGYNLRNITLVEVP